MICASVKPEGPHGEGRAGQDRGLDRGDLIFSHIFEFFMVGRARAPCWSRITGTDFLLLRFESKSEKIIVQRETETGVLPKNHAGFR